MPRILNSTLRDWLDLQPILESHSTLKVSLPLSEDASTFYYATELLSVGGNVYDRPLRSIGDLNLSMGKAADRVEVIVDNTEGLQGPVFYQSRDAIRGSRVQIGRLYYNPAAPGEQQPVVIFTGTIAGVTADEQEVRLSILSDLYAGGQVGATRLVSPTCQFKFKDPATCAYSGAGSTCTKLYDDATGGCLFYANQHHFGGALFQSSQAATQTQAGGVTPANQLVKITGVPVLQRQALNFVSGATAVDNPTTGETDVTVTGGDKTLLNQAVAVTNRSKLSIGLYNPLKFTDDPTNVQTVLTAPETDSAIRNLVTGFGADPLGATDISAQLQAAASQGAKVILSAGTYLMTDPVTLAVASETNSFIIEGHGIGSTTILFTGDEHAFIAPNGANSFFKIKDLKILCTNTDNTGDCFHLMGDAGSVNTHIEMNNVGVWNFGRWGINADNIQSSNIVNCWFRGQKAGHIRFFDSDDISAIKEPNANNITGCLLDNCQADDFNVAAIYLFHANGVNISGCTIQGNFIGSTGNLHAIYAENCDSLNLNGVWVEDLCSGGSGLYLKGCRAASINGYHGSGQYPVDIILENNPKTIKLSGCTLTNSVPHVVTIDSSFGVEIENSVLSDPSNIWGYENTGFIHIGPGVHYSSESDPNHTEYVGTDTLHSNWGENLYPNPNAVDDATGYTLNSTYVTRITSDSPSDVGACFELDTQGAADYPNMIADAPVFELDYVIPDNVPANFYTFSCWVKVVDDGAADDVTRYVGLGFVMFGSTGGQAEKTRQFKNQVQGFLNPPVGKWMSWCRNIYVPPTSVFGTGRTLRFRIKPEETTKGPNTPKIRIGGFRLAQGRNAQQGHAKFVTEEFTHTMRGPDGFRLASRPSAAVAPPNELAFRFDGTRLQQSIDTGAWGGLVTVSAPNKILGRYSAGAGDYQELTISTGLNLDGSGNLTASAATPPQINTTAFGSLPAASHADDLYLITDGHTIERDTGSAFETFGPIYKLTPPPTHAGWTDINSGAGTFEDQPRALHIQAPFNASDNLRGMDKAAPTAPYTITALVEINFSAQNYQQAGVMFADNSGKYETFEVAYISGAWKLRVNRWNSATSGAGSTPLDVGWYPTPRIWLRIRDDNTTNRLYSWSLDGKNFIQVHAEGRTNHITATRVGFFANGGTSAAVLDIRLLSWEVT